MGPISSTKPILLTRTGRTGPYLLGTPSERLNQLQTERAPLSRRPTAGIESQSQSFSWQQRVVQLFDPALRDAEDMMLSLPYADIREKADSFAASMDAARCQDRVLQEQSQIVTSVWPDTPVSSACISAQGNVSNQLHYNPLKLIDLMYVGILFHRMILMTTSYTCYNALTTIIVNYTQSMDHATEMQARRCLTAALAEMDELII